MTKKLLFITGTRADYGKLKPILEILLKNKKFDIKIFASGMHTEIKYGSTYFAILRDFPSITEVYSNNSKGSDASACCAEMMHGVNQYLKNNKVDLLIVHGDRVEALSAALVCASQNVRSTHIEGGEVSGTIDEAYRHCNSKLCTSHFVSSQSAKNRLIRMGEHPDRVFIIGSPELDTHKAKKQINLMDVLKYYEIPWEDFGIFIQTKGNPELFFCSNRFVNVSTKRFS